MSEATPDHRTVIQDFANRLAQAGSAPAIIWRGATWSYDRLVHDATVWRRRLIDCGVPAGAVVALEADFSLQAVAAFIALAEHRSAIVPLTTTDAQKRQRLAEIAECQWRVVPDADRIDPVPFGSRTRHVLYDALDRSSSPGLVLFSSGSSGTPKGAVHDLNRILAKFRQRRRTLRTAAFLLFDHIGGVNTLLYTLWNAGCLVIIEDRTADAVFALIERHRVELLPASPTFLNLVLMSGAHERFDASSLQLITYGTEPMPEGTLRAIHRVLPQVDLLQTYGLSEVGILRSKSKAPDSLWVKLGGPEFETRVVDGVLEIRAQSAMLGYLNAPSPFTADGWFSTGDHVEVDGEFVRFVGRASDIINVGGEKVFPIEVEEVLRMDANVADVMVFAKPNSLVGNVVAAMVVPHQHEAIDNFRERLVILCVQHLEPYKIPVAIDFVAEIPSGERFKRTRRIHTENDPR